MLGQLSMYLASLGAAKEGSGWHLFVPDTVYVHSSSPAKGELLKSGHYVKELAIQNITFFPLTHSINRGGQFKKGLKVC